MRWLQKIVTNRSSLAPLALALSAATLVPACGGEKAKYTPRQNPSAVKASLPPVPNVPKNPIKAGEAYTVWGASYYLRNRVHQQEVAGKQIKVTGYITKTNLADAPECAVHETGKEDPEDCVAPVPTFWLGETKDATDKNSIKVMGWASNFAQLYDAIKEYKKRSAAKQTDAEPLTDNFWGVKIPDPLPVQGAKVTVQGHYSANFTKATRGAAADPIMGILTYDELEYLEKPEEAATLPGM
jgi:hypothetical protein